MHPLRSYLMSRPGFCGKKLWFLSSEHRSISSRNLSLIWHSIKNAFYQDNRISRRCILFQHFFRSWLSLYCILGKISLAVCIIEFLTGFGCVLVNLLQCDSRKRASLSCFFCAPCAEVQASISRVFRARSAHFFGSFGTVRQRRLHVCQNRSPQCKVIFVSPLASMSSSAVRVFAKITTQQNLI